MNARDERDDRNSPQATSRARVLSSSRRFVHLLGEDFSEFDGKVSSKALDVTVGDEVDYVMKGEEVFVRALVPPRNSLYRSYRGTGYRLVANLDHLFIVAAFQGLFNTTFVDRVTTLAAQQNIPFSILVNKQDRREEETAVRMQIYRDLGYEVLVMSAKFDEGMDAIQEKLRDPAIHVVALTGVSGVGKSSILKRLLPGTELRVGDVSARTGQGKQTTTQAVAYRYPARSDMLLLVDLPGIQQFGVEHLTEEEIAESFDEIAELRAQCQFSNCSHTSEPRCAVRTALEEGRLAPSRYESYLGMIEESREAHAY